MSSTIAVFRGDFVESRHQVSVAVMGADGKTVATSGDPDRVAFFRSCAKPFQAIPLVELGTAEACGYGEDALALACASHSGEPAHVALALDMLGRSGASEADLVCGPHVSLNDDYARAMATAGQQPTKAHNNCSGKHAAMIATSRLQHWGSAGYQTPDHPIQRACLAEIARWSSLPAASVRYAVDGCGVPTFAAPIRAMALAWARLGVAAAGGSVQGIPEAVQRSAGTLLNAVRGKPFFVAGTHRLDSELIEGSQGRIVSKVGAEGVYCAAIPERGLGIALKVEDGAARCLGPALLGVLDLLAPDLVPPLAAHRRGETHNTLGAVVGHIEARMELHHAASRG